MDLVFIFNLLKGGNGYDLLLLVSLFLMGLYYFCGEFKIRGFRK